MRHIPLTQGKFAMVDDDAPTWIFEVKWYALRDKQRWIAVRQLPSEGGRRSMQLLHRVILKAPPNQKVDHISGDGLDDREENLRLATNVDNCRGFNNRQTNNTSGFRGVSWDKQFQKWRAYIRHEKRLIYIGLFATPGEAARARDAKARDLGWPESGMNFPSITQPA